MTSTELSYLDECIERLKIERDAIIRNASNAEITYNRQIKELLTKRRKILSYNHG